MAPPATSHEPFVGSILAGRYRVVRLIGKGGMGEVYEAKNVTIGRRVAIKRLAAELEGEGEGEGEVFSRFRREAEIVAGFQHPNIVGVLDWVTTDDGSPCIVMEYLRGEDLAARIERLGPMSWPELAHIADEVLSALAVAHRAGIVHRDIKPQNIFLAVDDEGRTSAKLLDFGVSKIHASSTLATPESQIIGTPAYMSPEQARGNSRDVDATTDIWAMGVVLYEMATGVLPFVADSVPSTLYRICHASPPALAKHRPDAPAELVAALEGCMTRDSKQRTSSAESLRRDLRAALSTVAPGAIRASIRKPAMPPDDARTAEGYMATLAAGSQAIAAAGSMAEPRGETAVAATLPSNPSVTTTLSSLVRALNPMPRQKHGWQRTLSLLLLATLLGAALLAIRPALWSSGSTETTQPPQATRSSPETAPPSIDEPARHTFSIASKPKGAQVFDGQNHYLGKTPLSYETDDRGLEVTLRLDGYVDRTIELDADGASPDPTELKREARARRRAKRAPAKSTTTSTEEKQAAKKKRLRGPYATDI